jgi:hypothetical protein
MPVKDLEGLNEAAKELSSPESIEATKLVLSVVAKDELEEVLYTRLVRWLVSAFEEVDKDDLMKAASAPSNAELLFWLFELPALRDALEKDPLMEAKLRGIQVRRKLLEAEGGTMGSHEVAELLSITPQAVDKRRKAEKLLALSTGRHGYRYPVWQFDEHSQGGTIPGFEEVMGSFEVEDPWMRASFFLRRNGRLGDRRPLDSLRGGEVETVKLATRAYGEHGAE